MTSTRPIRFEFKSTFGVPVRQLWRFYMERGALERLTPPLSGFRVVDPGAGVADGSVLEAVVGWWPLRRRWVAFHAAVRENDSFVDAALESPFAYWVHLHRFEPVGEGASRLIDVVWFLPPRGVPRWVGRILGKLALGWTFWWRHRATRLGLTARSASACARMRDLCGDAAHGGSS